MAFIVQCPFCKLRAKVPDRAVGGTGQCPRCASSFTFAAVDDQQMPDSPSPPNADAGEAATTASADEPEECSKKSAPAPAEALTAPGKAPPGYARLAGALALLLAGLALIATWVPIAHGLVRPLGALGAALGLIAVVACRGVPLRGRVLPIAGSVVSGGLLAAAWFLPALFGPAYEFSRRPVERTPPGLHAIPLAGAPGLAELPDLVDARRYALQRDGLRVQVIRVTVIPAKGKKPQAAEARVVVGVRISRESAENRPIERNEEAVPSLADDKGQAFRLVESECLDRGGGADKPGLYRFPTIEETLVFGGAAADGSSLRLELPAARWQGTGVFRFAIPATGW
jgi:hypothetical protein